jgi:outer membrane protein OmpA-like peptidoglycan-associated protein
MKSMTLPLCATSLLFASAFSGCAATVPQELANARIAYHRASTGPAARSKPAEVHKADAALQQAEQAFESDPKAYHTLDLAYIAQRKAEMAEAFAEIDTQEAQVAQSNAEFTSTQTQIMKQTKAALNQSRSDLAESERDGQKSQENLAVEKKARAETEKREATTRVETEKREAASGAQLATEQAARAAAEKRAADAVLALANLAAVKEEARGLVITLSGSVLFASDQSALLPSAQSRLSHVAEALLANGQRTIVVEGHSDSKGKDAHNVELSLRRAEAVRSFLISKGYDASRITAQGIGKDRPIADNGTVEGRANNRRVEIVVSPAKR